MKQEKIRIKVTLSEEENQKLKACSKMCGLSENEFVRQLCMGKTPQVKQSKEFWELLNSLYELHASLKKCVPFYSEAATKCKEIEALILQLQEI